MYSGGTEKEKDRLTETITEDVVKYWEYRRKNVRIVFQEASHENWYSSGIRILITIMFLTVCS
jgi:phenylpyruvate tautomerase PptA (4-oxalocrotonate tautomerase family)